MKVRDSIKVKEVRSVEVLNKGLWNESGKTSFATFGTAGFKICNEGNDSVEVDALDNILK